METPIFRFLIQCWLRMLPTILFEVENEKICTEQSLCCTSTTSFVVDCQKLAHPNDIRMDDMEWNPGKIVV